MKGPTKCARVQGIHAQHDDHACTTCNLFSDLWTFFGCLKFFRLERVSEGFKKQPEEPISLRQVHSMTIWLLKIIIIIKKKCNIGIHGS